MRVESAPSVNFNERLHKVDMLVLHYTGMQTSKAALKRMQDSESKVSSHYLIGEIGEIYQLVSEDKRAWHAGISKWQGDTDLNSRSIGIEIANGGWNIPLTNGTLPPYHRSQIESTVLLCREILSNHEIPQSRIVGHSDISPDRKDDPGEHFPWEYLAQTGISLWPKQDEKLADRMSVPAETSSMFEIRETQMGLADIGYAIEVNGELNAETRYVVKAFQRRFLQNNVNGNLDLITRKRIKVVRDVYLSLGATLA